jgi:hypothetical protein
MAEEVAGPWRAQLAARAAAILLRPSRTWQQIEGEPSHLRTLYRTYVAPLAAVPAVCGALGVAMFGIGFANIGVRQSLVGTLLEALSGYMLTLVLVYVAARLVAVTAGAFGGVRNDAQALKLVAYSATPVWVAGVLNLYPSLSLPAGILAALYSLYILYLGLPLLLRVPEARLLTCFAALLLILLALVGVRNFVSGQAAELGGPLSAVTARPEPQVSPR